MTLKLKINVNVLLCRVLILGRCSNLWGLVLENVPFAMDDVSSESVEKLIDHAELFLEEQYASDDKSRPRCTA